jgi:IS30 family transposase
MLPDLSAEFSRKKTDFADVTASEIATVEKSLNNRPRKCLNFLTPLEAMANECVALNP